jgi:segregation and condensation protein B
MVNKVISSETAKELDNTFIEKEKENREKVEAALFISGRFLNLQDLIMLTDINPIMLKEILNELERKYSTGAITLINQNNNWKMDVSEKYHYLINRLATGEAEFSKAEQETLAVIAYKTPVKQSLVIKIRGNKAYDHVKRFIDLGLVSSKELGHTNELTLTDKFYDYFNVIQGSNPKNILKNIQETDNNDSEDEEIPIENP